MNGPCECEASPDFWSTIGGGKRPVPYWLLFYRPFPAYMNIARPNCYCIPVFLSLLIESTEFSIFLAYNKSSDRVSAYLCLFLVSRQSLGMHTHSLNRSGLQWRSWAGPTPRATPWAHFGRLIKPFLNNVL